MKKERAALEFFIIQLKSANDDERRVRLDAVEARHGRIRLPAEVQPEPDEAVAKDGLSDESLPHTPLNRDRPKKTCSPIQGGQPPSVESLESDSEEECDIGPFISLDEAGRPSSFGPSSALHCPPKEVNGSMQTVASAEKDLLKHSLIAKAALQRQSERLVASLPDIFGVPTELGTHLLDLHWSRQHHTFLLTYRPAIMRDLLTGGPHCSRFLIHAIFACVSKYSGRAEVLDDPNDAFSRGRQFFRHCDELLARDSLLTRPNIPTVVGLLLLGSTYNARGETSKGWLYTGYALRMVYDLGLHLDPSGAAYTAEEAEIRRRVFWGAFICDKLQSLYLGRPVGINLRDAHVSREFWDTFEEQELYLPFTDPQLPLPHPVETTLPATLHSVSTFQQLCLLSKIMSKIIGTFYVVGATPRNAQSSLELVDTALQTWQKNLPQELQYNSEPDGFNLTNPAPNQMNLHGVYHSLIILLHRPFISDGHLRLTVTPLHSWRRCTAAARSITSIALAWKNTYSLVGAPYLLSYVIYVACTIHVRNAAAEGNNRSNREHSSLLAASLPCLRELCTANPGVSAPIKIIERMMKAKNIQLSAGKCVKIVRDWLRPG